MAETRDILKNLRKKNNNLTILMSSHMLHEVGDMCDRITMINHGSMLMEGRMEDVLGANSMRNITMKVVGGPNDDIVRELSKLQNVQNPQIVGTSVKFAFKGGDEDQQQLLRDHRTRYQGIQFQ